MGGSAREWSVELSEPLMRGGAYDVELTMTKVGPPAVTIGFELVVL